MAERTKARKKGKKGRLPQPPPLLTEEERQAILDELFERDIDEEESEYGGAFDSP